MNQSKKFHLGSVLVDAELLRLSSKVATIEVQPRVMDVIVALSTQDKALISREALGLQVWCGTHVGYHALARAIYEARKALAVVAPEEEIIQTVPKRGYRMLVSRRDEMDASPVTSLASPPDLVQSIPGGRAVLGASALVALGLCMHAAGAHGSSTHLVVAAAIIGGTAWYPAIAASVRETRSRSGGL